MGEKKNAYKLLLRKPEGKRPLGRPRQRRMDNIKVDLVDIICGSVDWIDVAQERYRWREFVNAVMDFLLQ
jgi:hypothetical protein